MRLVARRDRGDRRAADGWDALSYREPIASDVEPILFPWGGVRSQVWRWDGTHFTKGKEVAQKEQIPGGGDARAPAARHPAEPPTPKVSRGRRSLGARSSSSTARTAASPADAAPKVDLKVHVAGDARPERVVLIGRDVVVFGPGFKGGIAYAYITLSQFADAATSSDLSARDLTGDGAADLVVRGVRHVSGDGGAVDSELMFVYQVGADSIDAHLRHRDRRASRASKRVQGLVQFIPAPGGKSFDILAAPGRATGWTEKTYPWTQDQPGGGAIEPLLLPWGGIGSLRYRWTGSQFAKQECRWEVRGSRQAQAASERGKVPQGICLLATWRLALAGFGGAPVSAWRTGRRRRRFRRLRAAPAGLGEFAAGAA